MLLVAAKSWVQAPSAQGACSPCGEVPSNQLQQPDPCPGLGETPHPHLLLLECGCVSMGETEPKARSQGLNPSCSRL